MIWNSWGDFFAMGGYAFYVWGSIIMVAGCMAGELVSLKMRRKAILAQHKHRHESSKRVQGRPS